MSLLAICCVAVGAIGLLKLGWTALKPLPEETVGRRQDRMEDLLALHAQHFPQLRQALTTLDDDYVRRKASGDMERHVKCLPRNHGFSNVNGPVRACNSAFIIGSRRW